MVGRHLIAFARTWFDEATVVRVFEPLIADWQRECASVTGLPAILCRARGYAAFATTVAVMLPREIVRPIPGGVAGATWAGVELVGFASALLGAYAFQIVTKNGDRELLGRAFSMAWGIGVLFALASAAFILSTSESRHPCIVRRVMTRLGLLYMATTVVAIAFGRLPRTSVALNVLMTLSPLIAIASGVITSRLAAASVKSA